MKKASISHRVPFLFLFKRQGLIMLNDILSSATLAFEAILKYKYHVTLGKKGKATEINIQFSPDNFFHLAGFQHLKQKYWSCSDKKVFSKILSHEISVLNNTYIIK